VAAGAETWEENEMTELEALKILYSSAVVYNTFEGKRAVGRACVALRFQMDHKCMAKDDDAFYAWIAQEHNNIVRLEGNSPRTRVLEAVMRYPSEGKTKPHPWPDYFGAEF
jgi:hypothetical protein